jgi:LacI family transcriptional regulator
MLINREMKKTGKAKASRLSIGDVAKASGVSIATVSRVLNGLGGASGETIEHVKRTAVKLAYQPLRMRRRAGERAAGARRAGTGNVAMITLGEAGEWLQLPIMAAAVNGVRAATDVAGYRLILSEVRDPFNHASLFQKREIDGAIVFVSSSFNSEKISHALELLNARWPVVWAMGGPLAVEVDHIYADHYRIGQMAYAYLRDSGCQEMAYVTTSPGWPLMRLRSHGFLDAASDADRHARAFILGKEASLARSYGLNVTMAHEIQPLVQKLANATPKVDGLFIANDRTAAELYPLLMRAGMKPGHDLTIISCDNEEVRLSALDPRPASIEVGAEQIGKRAVGRLLKRIAEPKGAPLTIQVMPRLVLPRDA